MLSSESNIAAATDLASSVLPTPVGPKNKNEPIGRCSSLIPLLLRRIARATAETALSWPITRLCKRLSRLANWRVSLRFIWVTGTPVQSETTLAMSSGSTIALALTLECKVSINFSRCACKLFCSSCNWAALTKFWLAAASFFWSIKFLILSLICTNLSLEPTLLRIFTAALASSTKSIALSGKNLSEM